MFSERRALRGFFGTGGPAALRPGPAPQKQTAARCRAAVSSNDSFHYAVFTHPKWWDNPAALSDSAARCAPSKNRRSGNGRISGSLQLGVQFLDRVHVHVAHGLHALDGSFCTEDGREGGHTRQEGAGTDGTRVGDGIAALLHRVDDHGDLRSEEHTSELQSPCNLV